MCDLMKVVLFQFFSISPLKPPRNKLMSLYKLPVRIPVTLSAKYRVQVFPDPATETRATRGTLLVFGSRNTACCLQISKLFSVLKAAISHFR